MKVRWSNTDELLANVSNCALLNGDNVQPCSLSACGEDSACFIVLSFEHLSRILLHTMAKNRPIRRRDTKKAVCFSLVKYKFSFYSLYFSKLNQKRFCVRLLGVKTSLVNVTPLLINEGFRA